MAPHTNMNISRISGDSSVTPPVTGSLSERRFGFGRNVTIPTDKVVVGSWADIQSVGPQPNKYIELSPALAGQTILMTNQVTLGAGTTVDGSTAPGHILSSTSGTCGFRLSNGNNVVHCIKMDGNNSSSNRIWLLAGSHYWIDHCEAYDSSDDVYIISTDNGDALSDITFSWLYSHNNNQRGMLINAKTANPVERITISGCWLSNNNARNFRWQGADQIHAYNNFTENASIGINARIPPGNVGPFSNARCLLESCVYENVSNPLNIQTQSSGVDPAWQHWLYTDGLNDYGGGSVTRADHIDGPTAPAMFSIPYAYEKIPTAQVKATVIANAGCQ